MHVAVCRMRLRQHVQDCTPSAGDAGATPDAGAGGDPPGDLQVSGRMGGSMGGQESSVRVRNPPLSIHLWRVNASMWIRKFQLWLIDLCARLCSKIIMVKGRHTHYNIMYIIYVAS